MHIGVLLLVSLLLTGCTSFASLVQSLNERELKSCVKWGGSIAAGAGIGGAGAVQALTLTGGMSMDDCIKAKDAGVF